MSPSIPPTYFVEINLVILKLQRKTVGDNEHYSSTIINCVNLVSLKVIQDPCKCFMANAQEIILLLTQKTKGAESIIVLSKHLPFHLCCNWLATTNNIHITFLFILRKADFLASKVNNKYRYPTAGPKVTREKTIAIKIYQPCNN